MADGSTEAARHYPVRAHPLLRATARAAAAGAVVGLVFAVREVAAGPYLAYRLWLDVLRILSRDMLFGAAAGAAATALMCLLFLARRARLARGPLAADPTIGPGATPRALSRLITFFAAGGAAATLCVPTQAPPLLELSHWTLFGGGLTLICGVLAARAPMLPERGRAPSGVAVVWPAVLALSLLVGLTHLWTRAWDWSDTAVAAAAAAVAALFLYLLLSAPAAAAVRRLLPVASAVAHPAVQRVPVAVLAAAAMLWAATSCAMFWAHHNSLRSGRNVLFISVDALRYDAVSLLSPDEHERDLTPELRRRLASRGTVFTHAYAQAPWTLPSFSSMFTGRYPEQHRADRIDGALGPAEVTLAEILRNHGYATMAVISTYFLTRKVGVIQGFAQVDESQSTEGTTVSSAEITDRALRFLKTVGDRRFFLFLHYFDPHNPYLRHPEVERTSRPRGKPAPPGMTAGLSRVSAERRKEVAGMRDRYTSEVAFTDLHIGRLLRYLDERDLWRNTCVILVADHGDEFLEHGGIYHSRTLYQEILHVPLAIVTPDRRLPRVVAEPVETRWLFGTVLRAAGIAPPVDAAAAPSLLTPSARKTGWARSSLAGWDLSDTWLRLSSLTGKQYQLIQDHRSGESMLFDIAADPYEQHDVRRELPQVLEQFQRTLAAADAKLSGERREGPSRRLSDDERRRLKALGYL